MMSFEETLAQCGPTISYWRGRAYSMGLDADDVEQELTIKLHKIATETSDLRSPLPVYFKVAARNCVLDMQRVCQREARRAVALEALVEIIPSSSSVRNLEDAEFQIDLERAGLSRDAIRFVRVALESGGRGARPAFGATTGAHRRFYRARNEIRRFLERRKEAVCRSVEGARP